MMNKTALKLISMALCIVLIMLAISVPGVANDTVANPTAQSDGDLIAYYSFDDINGTTLPDRSGNGHNGTIKGTASVTLGKLGTAIKFEKAGDCVSVPHSEELHFAATDSYTVSFWVKPEELDAWQCVIAKNRSTARAYMGFWFDAKRFAYCQGSDGSAWFDSPRYDGAVNDTWYNVVMVQDATANKSFLYVDGVKVVERNYTKPCSGTTPLFMGNGDGINLNQFYGSLDEVKIYGTAKSAAEITEAYNADKANAGSTVAYWDFENITDGVVPDVSGNGHNGNIGGTVDSVKGKLGKGVNFSEHTDYISVPHSTDFNFAATDSYTISLWVKPDVINAQQCVINKGRQNSNGNYTGLWVQHNSLLFSSGYEKNGSTTTYYDVRKQITVPNVWYHVVMVQDASLGKSILYVNGELAAEKAYTRAVTGTDNLIMGNVWANNNTSFQGSIDDVKIEKRAMGLAEAKYIYDNIMGSNLLFHYDFDDVTETTVPDSSFHGNDGTIVGTPEIRGNGKVGNAMYITNDGDGFTVADNDSFDFTSTDSFTLSAWIKADSYGGWRNIAAKNREDTGAQYYGLFLNSNSLTFAMGVRTVGGVKSWPAISTKIETGEWYNVVLVQDGEAGKSYMYLDGVLVGTADATYDYKGSTPWEIGGRFSANKEYFKGGIDELKLYNTALAADEIETEYEAQEKANPDFAKYTEAWPSFDDGKTPNIILDMDLGGDSDDLGAIAILYYYHQKGLVNLLATTTPRQVWYAGAMSAINTYYGYPDMSIGFNGNKYNNINDSAYGRYLSMNFSNPVIDNMEFENSVKVIRKALSEAEDKSVTFCVTGTYTNLYNLLLSSADEYSDLSGYDLVKKKVKWIVGMGCQYPEGREANIYNDVVAAKYVNQNWPTPILYSTWEVGNPVLTATRETLDRMDENNPIRVGYEEHFRNLKYGIPRPSWDPITAYFACAGFSEYYDLHRADVAIDNVGNSVFFDNETTGARAYLIKKDNVTNEQMAAILDDKMVAAEGRIENGLYCDYIDDIDNRLTKNSTNATTETVTHAFIGREWHDTYYKSEDVGASIEVTFEGTSFTIYGGYLTSGGIVDIYLDGKLIDSVDTYNSTNYLSSHLYHKDGLTKSTHTLKLVTSDKKNTASSGNSFLLDFIKVDTFEVLKGDINGDGNIDVCDLVATQNIIDGKAPFFSAADMNSDGKIDSLDAAEIRKIIISK